MNKLTVVMYHYVRDLKNSKYKNIRGLDTSLFIEQIKYIKRNYNVITMNDLFEFYENKTKLPKKALLLTFDDGYIDHYDTVFPLLIENKLSGCFYPPIKVISDHCILDVNKIHFILASTSSENIISFIKHDLILNKHEFGLQDFDYYYLKLAIESRFDDKDTIFIKRLLQMELNIFYRERLVNKLFEKFVNVEEKEFSKSLYMCRDNLIEMINNGMHIGSHGYNHYWWDKLDDNEIEQEIKLSLDFLKDIGVNVSQWSVCYPYGAFSKKALELLTQYQCKVGFTTQVDIANLSTNNPLLLPRLDTNDLPKDSKVLENKWLLKV